MADRQFWRRDASNIWPLSEPTLLPKISNLHHPIANLENPFAFIAIDIAEGCSKLGDWRWQIGNFGDGMRPIYDHFLSRRCFRKLAICTTRSPIWKILLHSSLSILQKDVPNWVIGDGRSAILETGCVQYMTTF